MIFAQRSMITRAEEYLRVNSWVSHLKIQRLFSFLHNLIFFSFFRKTCFTFPYLRWINVVPFWWQVFYGTRRQRWGRSPSRFRIKSESDNDNRERPCTFIIKKVQKVCYYAADTIVWYIDAFIRVLIIYLYCTRRAEHQHAWWINMLIERRALR